MNSHRILQSMAGATHKIEDPGDAGRIYVDRDLAIVELVSEAAETRTLANPIRAGIRLCLYMKTDGGTIRLTASNGLNVALDKYADFDTAGDTLDLISVSLTSTTFRWHILINSTTPLPSTSVSSSPSASASSSPSSSPS